TRDERNGRWLLMVLSHHSIVDHSTLEMILQEVRLRLAGQNDRLAPSAPFRDFVAQARFGVSPQEHERFFKRMLGKVDEATAPFGLVQVREDGSRIDQQRVMLDSELSRRLRERARLAGVSAASVFHLAWGQVLSRLCGRDEVVFGTLLLGRMQG